jgi:hypothetical protein
MLQWCKKLPYICFQKILIFRASENLNQSRKDIMTGAVLPL